MGREALGDSRFGIGDARFDSLTARHDAVKAAAAFRDKSANIGNSSDSKPRRRSAWRVIAPIALLATAAGAGDAINVDTKVKQIFVGNCRKVEDNHTYEPGQTMEGQVRQYDPNGDWRADVGCTVAKNGLPNSSVRTGQKANTYVHRRGLIR